MMLHKNIFEIKEKAIIVCKYLNAAGDLSEESIKDVMGETNKSSVNEVQDL